MMKRVSNIFLKSAVSMCVLFSCATATAGGPDEPSTAPFDGFSVLAGPTAIYLDLESAQWQSQLNVATTVGSLLTPVSLPVTANWSTSARLGIEFGQTMSSFYLGMNANYFTGITWRQAFTAQIPDNTNNITASNTRYVFSVNHLLNALLKVGFAFNLDNCPILLYGQAGTGGMRVTMHDISNANQTIPLGQRWLAGWAAGGGAEILITKSMAVGADYQYSEYQRFDLQGGAITATTANQNPAGWFSASPNMQTITLYFKYLFNS